MPRFNPMVTACVRSLARSFDRIFVTWLLTVSSVMAILAAISLFAFPAAISRSTPNSRAESSLSAACSAISAAISGGMRLYPACTDRMVSNSSRLTLAFKM